LAYGVRLGRYSFDTGLSIRPLQTNRSETRFRLMTLKSSTLTGFWTDVNFIKFEESRGNVDQHNKANRRLTLGYDPENRHVRRNNDLYFFSSAVSCPKSNANSSLRPVMTRKFHDSDLSLCQLIGIWQILFHRPDYEHI